MFDKGINSVWNTDTTAGPFFCLPVRYLNTVKMESYEYNFCLCAVNTGIVLHIKLFKGISIMKHIMLVFIYVFL